MVGSLQSDLQTRNLDAAQADAVALLDQAEALGRDADAAEGRQRPLDPHERDLVNARKQALRAFGLTAEYANAVTGIANAASSFDLSELAGLIEDAAELAGTSDDLTRAYADLNGALAAYAESNPAAAAKAIATYGS